MPDRRYDDDEVAAIFQRAAENPDGHSLQAPHSDGMTLAELQAIGREAGIAPDAVARAAQSLDIRASSGERPFLGLPIGVERTIAFDRRLTESEWERLVVQLRETFAARGVVGGHGSFRQWTNGNLQALLEPTATGHRLRLLTRKGNARASVTVGTMLIGLGTFTAVAAAAAGHLLVVLPEIAMFVGSGAGAIILNAVRLPGWARTRSAQMEAIETRLALETRSDSSDLSPSI